MSNQLYRGVNLQSGNGHSDEIAAMRRAIDKLEPQHIDELYYHCENSVVGVTMKPHASDNFEQAARIALELAKSLRSEQVNVCRSDGQVFMLITHGKNIVQILNPKDLSPVVPLKGERALAAMDHDNYKKQMVEDEYKRQLTAAVHYLEEMPGRDGVPIYAGDLRLWIEKESGMPISTAAILAAGEYTGKNITTKEKVTIFEAAGKVIDLDAVIKVEKDKRGLAEFTLADGTKCTVNGPFACLFTTNGLFTALKRHKVSPYIAATAFMHKMIELDQNSPRGERPVFRKAAERLKHPPEGYNSWEELKKAVADDGWTSDEIDDKYYRPRG